MKRILLAMLVLTSSIGFAQDYNEEVDLFQAYYGMQKKQVVELIVKVDDASSESFWALYEEYETKRKEIGKKRFAILDKYVEKHLVKRQYESSHRLQQINEYLYQENFKNHRCQTGSPVLPAGSLFDEPG